MKLSDIAGKKIVSVRQGWVDADGRRTWAVEAIILDDGTKLRFSTIELVGDYATYVIVAKVPKPTATR